MMEKKVDFQSELLEPFDSEPRVVECYERPAVSAQREAALTASNNIFGIRLTRPEWSVQACLVDPVASEL